MAPETQGKTTNSMNNEAKRKQKLLRIKTGALSVLSYSPTCSILAQAQIRLFCILALVD